MLCSLVPLVVDDALVRQPLPELPLLCVCVITENQFYSYCWIGLQVSNETKPGTRSTPPPHDPPVWAVGGFQQLNGLFNTSKSRAARARPPLAGAGINYQQFNGLKKFNKSSGTIEPICRLSIRHQSFFLWQVFEVRPLPPCGCAAPTGPSKRSPSFRVCYLQALHFSMIDQLFLVASKVWS